VNFENRKNNLTKAIIYGDISKINGLLFVSLLHLNKCSLLYIKNAKYKKTDKWVCKYDTFDVSYGCFLEE
jgi:hypothetical protein